MIKLKSILLNEDIPDDVKTAFGEIPFGGRPTFAAITTRDAPTDTKTEQDTDLEDELIEILSDWSRDSSSVLADKLYKHYSILKKASKYFPNTLKPRDPNGTPLYRGLKYPNVLKDEDLKKMTMDDFNMIETPLGNFYEYKYPVNYIPRSLVQSWTSDFWVGSNFGTHQVLKTKQNDQFLFNQELMWLIYGEDDESEVLHFGKEYSDDVYLVFTERGYGHVKKQILSSIKDFDDLPKTKEEVKNRLDIMGIRHHYTINDDLSVDLAVSVDISHTKLTFLPIKFNRVLGDFICFANQLSSWENFPKEVGGDLICSHNKFESLEGMPQKIGNQFVIASNKLKSIKGISKEIGGHINLTWNEIESLEDCPKNVYGGFDVDNNKLKSLKGGPEFVKGDFSCEFNFLTSLKEGPKKVGRSYYCSLNKLSDDEKKWAESNIEVGGVDYAKYSKPIEYKPERQVQSWTTSKNISVRFGASAVLISKQNNEYLFSQKAMRIFAGGDDEKEVMHFGKEFSDDVYIALSVMQFKTLFK